MYKNFFLPIHLFLILEKINLNYFYSKNSKFKTFYFLINKKWFNLFFKVLKYEIFTFFSTLIEASSVHLKNFNLIKTNFFNKKNFLIFYNFFLYSNSTHIIVSTLLTTNKTNLKSADKTFLNANWLERELSEMYGISFIHKKDNRKLLLDYSKNENPMLKDFPCEGILDVYYNFFDSQINYIQNEIVEL